MLRFVSILPLLACFTPALAVDRPNIVLFYADDLDFDEVPFYDHAQMPCPAASGAKTGSAAKPHAGQNIRLHMPHLAQLGREGMVLNRFYITSPICTPSRYSLLTGRYASRSPGFLERQPPGTQANIQWNTPLDPAETNIARSLKQLGYVTGFAGKWHNVIPHAAVRGLDPSMDPHDPRVNPAAQKAQQRRSQYLCDAIGFDSASRIHNGNKEQENIPEALRAHNLAWIAEGAVQFIRAHRDQPFFLYMSVTIPHSRFHKGLLQDDPLATVGGMLHQQPTVMPPRDTVARRAKDAGVAEKNFVGTWLDDSVGAITNTLDSLGIADNTVFIFISDHQSRGKYTCYEGARVPAVVRWPGHIPAGTTSDTICANIDIVPTLLELAGATPTEPSHCDGRSLLAPWTSAKTPTDWREALLLECSSARAVVTPRWKYIACRATPSVAQKMQTDADAAKQEGRARLVDWSGNVNPHPRGRGGIRYGADRHFPAYFDTDQLYDLQSDFMEQTNVAHAAQNAEQLQRLQRLLTELLQPLPHTFGEFKK